MKLTISAAARLYGIHRATLHRYLKNGRVSRAEFADGSPAVDFAELRRALGEPVNAPEVRQPATPPVALGATPNSDALMRELVELNRQQAAQLERMSDRIERLEAALLRLPAPAEPLPAQTDQAATEPPRDFSDLLARFESRTKR